MGPGSRSRSLSSGGASRRPVGSLVRDDVDEAIFPFNFQTVIPGWSEGPDPESRDSGLDASHRPGMTGSGLLRRFRLRSLSYGGQVAPRTAMTPVTRPRSRGAMRPRFAKIVSPLRE